MYEDVRIQIRMGGQLGLPFNSDVGVTQGDPLSPLLLGLFIDRFEQYLADNCDEYVARAQEKEREYDPYDVREWCYIMRVGPERMVENRQEAW